MAVIGSVPALAGLHVRPAFRDRLDLPRRVVFLAAASMVAIVFILLGFIAWQGIQLFVHNGVPIGSVISTNWSPEDEPISFGVLPFVVGTIGVTGVAVLISAPLSIGLALFLSEVAPAWGRAVVQPALEIFVGIPSVVWGWLGLTILVPFLRSNLSGLGFTLGFSWFAGSLVLSIMILPTITTITYDAFRAVPQELRTGSLALGTTRWQTIRHILLPAAKAGTLTAIVLGLTRAAGEALAVQMVIGNRPTMPTSLTQPMTTLTSQITLDMGNTVFGAPDNNVLWTMGLILLTISMVAVLLIRTLNRAGGRR